MTLAARHACTRKFLHPCKTYVCVRSSSGVVSLGVWFFTSMLCSIYSIYTRHIHTDISTFMDVNGCSVHSNLFRLDTLSVFVLVIKGDI